MSRFSTIRPSGWHAGIAIVLGACVTSHSPIDAPRLDENAMSSTPHSAQHSDSNRPSDGAIAQLDSDRMNSIQRLVPDIDPDLRNAWPPKLESGFWNRADEAINYYLQRRYGSTAGENEKRSYPIAMFHALAGDRQSALDFLQSEDADADDNRHTEGIDYYYAFTLKGQMRKYFLFNDFLNPDYRERMRQGADAWTEEDPNDRPHPNYGDGDGGNGWGPEARGGWVDGRNTDNLRAMRETSVYLMAEETNNEAVRQLYKEKIQRYVWALYHIGMGEWDSENYHDHTFTAYLNLYDFAQDPEVKRLAKASLDWLSAAAAVKYYRGGFGGPSKRDYGEANVVFGSATARLFWHYFDDAIAPNPEPQRDAVHVITSAYRPPQAVVALAHKEFDRPTELLSTKPIYENWRPGQSDKPAYWETTFFGHTYQMGSVVSSFADGDVGPFKLMADNSQRGVDYFVANTGRGFVKPGKHAGDQIGQYQNLLIWLRPADDRPFFFQIPQTATAEIEDGIWFFQFESTWLAVHPINLDAYAPVEIPDDDLAEHYAHEQTLKATTRGNSYAGFALEVGEAQSHGDYETFKQAVKSKSELDLGAIAQTVQLTSSTNSRLQITHNPDNELPTVMRNGIEYDWLEHFDLYRLASGTSPITLGWKQGRLRVEAGGHLFETAVSDERLVIPQPE
ncbi:MAG: hypothetical protein ACFE0J_22335 [Elainellaceae cyanobacterium]